MASRYDESNADSLKETVLMNLRSVTQSRKGGVPLSCLERDYRDLLGNSIPFRDLGYTSLQAFLRDIPGVISLRQKDGQLVAEGVADSSTAHIVSLVNRQKTAKTIVKPGRRPYALHRRGGYSSKYSSRSSRTISPKRIERSYRATSYHDNTHSKPTQSIHREPREARQKNFNQNPSPEPPKVQHVPPRKYEVAPRFLRLQQQSRETTDQRVYRDESPGYKVSKPDSPNKRVPRMESPEPPAQHFIREPYSNNHIIRSPRPLLSTRTTAVKSDRLRELDSAATSKEYVFIYASMNDLEIKYVTKPMGQKKKYKSFISSLCLGEKKYHSYPELASTEEEAEEIAAKNAVKAIQESREHLASCPETPLRNAEDVQILIDRIEEIVCEKPSGMFTNGIVNEYEHKYNATLPENWLKLLHQSSVVEIEELAVPYGRVPEGVNCIVRLSRLSSGSTTPSSTSELEKVEHVYEDNSVPKSIVRRDHLPDIPKLPLPIGNEWAVFVVDVSKTIAARLIDYDNAFLDMAKKMKDFYSSECLPAVEITEGLLYATCEADSDVYHRVLVQKVKDSNTIECYFVDEGVFADVSKSDLQELNTEFWKLPYQAIHMTLDGLEDYVYKPDDLKILLGTTFVALVKRGNTMADDYFPEDPSVHKIIYSVVLYNTSGSEDVNMNEIIKDKVLESFTAELPKPSISASGYFLTHVESTGEIFLRNLPLDSWLEESLEKLSQVFEEECMKNVTVPHGKVCVAKYEDGRWYRAVLMQDSGFCTNPEEVNVFFIDYGNTSNVPVNAVCELEPYSEFLSLLGAQAIKCELYSPLPSPDAEWTTAAIAKLLDLAPSNEELLIRVINEGEDSALPKVNLYKRTYQNGDSFIISINESLANEPELFNTPKPRLNPLPNSSLKLNLKNDIRPPVPRTTLSNFNNISHAEESLPMPIMPPIPANDFKWAVTPDNIKSPDALEDHNPPPLKLPEVPDKGERFDVYVTMAAHPHNFYVQPYKTVKEMNELMSQMNQFYSSEDNLIEMPISLLKENGFYAVQHSDENWYRAQLQSIMNSDPITVIVRYVDFGDLVTVSMLQLQSLYTKFRELPCQAIKAALAGIKPIENDWDPLHCVKFQEMVREREFVSIVQKKSVEELKDISVCELELTLIDVRTDEDIYIHELLIERGMAQSV